ncbi:hypothetical protein Cni_G16674 [Canna indica]|uniref:RNase H type-1 domain-containing protein n=1 Tax=Canna indica TaxID=4628 RepID=A0AAQ3KGG0_9LILI|nr:hypothetical protein Cni_G16674 [Canna indica]
MASDHCPLVLSILNSVKPRQHSFKFQNFWIDYPEVREIVEDCWNDNSGYPPFSKITKHLSHLRGSGKSPCPDGYTGKFLETYWNIISEDFVSAFNFFHEYEVLPDGWNDTCLVFIPKNDNPCVIKDYRPIALCNVAYRILAKVIANRLKPYLNDLISSNQSAFIFVAWDKVVLSKSLGDLGLRNLDFMRDCNGNLIFATALLLYDRSVLENEALAIKLAVDLAAMQHHSHVIIESDSKLLVDMCCKRIGINWRVRNIINNILLIADKFEELSITFIKREANAAVDWLANQARRMERNLTWGRDWPPDLIRIVKKDIGRGDD